MEFIIGLRSRCYRNKRSWDGNDLKLYQALQLFSITLNDFGSTFCAAFNVILTACPVVFIYVALTVSGIHFLIFLVFPSISFACIALILAFLPQDSRIQSLSSELLTQMKKGIRACNSDVTANPIASRKSVRVGHNEGRFRRKKILALYPLGIRIGIFGVYTLDTSQELMNQLLNNLLLLLSL